MELPELRSFIEYISLLHSKMSREIKVGAKVQDIAAVRIRPYLKHLPIFQFAAARCF